ncbi:WcbI family polysaccharide biosynthesis putative acetyltransferase [Sphingomonas sp. BIUV-7]|uniref:WcbI family polysaccharide biosynthesis putative acetyltransferase n=1 Tax=Sphingomonas natans TaxID=3063330 RepID=A0ABT8Y5V6_9SPHN|nr:WcbI family polysaccharide biosynthesis putative acetyltransferase [Sphingomonas sp. BIUV-7]MDO6413691.1 WcbI family polysaccharide biosynthesis putative acetyltransferase [Sphingomonas sp. BIUV-7]
MRRKQVRVIGNCQAWAVASFYRDFVGAPNGEDVKVVDDLGLDAAALRVAVQDADVVIVQERDFKHGLSKEELGGNLDVFGFPLVMAGFMWPHANEPHINNVSEWPISDGPYPSQMGDSYLNRLISRGVSPEDALDQYLSLDIAKAAHIDRLMELYLDRQRQRDAAVGFNIAPIIEAEFRTRKLFLTAEHPDAWLFGVIAKQLFESMNVPGDIISNALSTLTRSPFPPTELALHPGVIKHFGLTFADQDDTYRFAEEGRITFSEYVLRYMRYESNPKLREAIYMAGKEDPSLTLQRLDQALVGSPQSIRAHSSRAEMLRLLNRLTEAEAAYHEAILLDPDNADLYVELARMLSRAGQCDRAEEFARIAIAKEPAHGGPYVMLAEALIYSGRIAEALEPGRRGIRLSPGDAHGHRMYAIALHASGRLEEAEQVVRQGLLIQPSSADHRNLLAETLEGQERRSESLEALEDALETGCKNDQTYSLLGNFLMRAGELDRAEQVFSEGADLYGHFRPDLRDCARQVQQMRSMA